MKIIRSGILFSQVLLVESDIHTHKTECITVHDSLAQSQIMPHHTYTPIANITYLHSHQIPTKTPSTQTSSDQATSIQTLSTQTPNTQTQRPRGRGKGELVNHLWMCKSVAGLMLAIYRCTLCFCRCEYPICADRKPPFNLAGFKN